MTDLRADLKADLLADLAGGEEPPQVVNEPDVAALPSELAQVTPAVAFQWTPLRWSRPRVVTTKDGLGKAVRVGPFAIELSVSD